MDAYRIHDMLENVSEAATTELSKGTEAINTHEFGEVVDMIKDLTEAEKNKMEACYYKTLVEAMEDAEYGKDYDEEGPIWDDERMGYLRMRDSRGRYTSSRRGYNGQGRGRRNYDEMMEDPRFMEEMESRMYGERNSMGYSNGAYGGGRRGQTSNMGSMGSGNSSSRYGYSHDDYMQKKSSMQGNDPETMKKRAKMIDEHMDDMYEMFKEEVQDMSPEEKQMWKSKLNKIINL